MPTDHATSMRPRAAMRLLLLLLLIPLAACPRSSETPQTPAASSRPPARLVFILLDAVRPDHLTPYGYARDTTPFLARIASRGVVFERAYAPSSWTPSSMASIFTSLHVNQHGVLTGFQATKRALARGDEVRLNRIPAGVQTLPEVLRGLGYQTFGVADNLNICEQMGFARGFDHFAPHDKQGSDVVQRTLQAWLPALQAADRYFLYIHYMDAHSPYQPRAPWYEANLAPGRENVAAYDSNLSLLDQRVQEVWELLGLDEDSLVVITADHGEEFRDHGGVGHRNQLYEELLRVPLILHYPARLSPRRVVEPVSTIDLLPTFRAAAGGPPAASDQGVSLLDTLEGPPRAPRSFVAMRWSETDVPPLVRKSVVRESWKYILSLPAGSEELYDLASDPRERRNLARERADVVADLRGRLDELERSAEVHPREYGGSIEITPEQAKRLQALGYVQ